MSKYHCYYMPQNEKGIEGTYIFGFEIDQDTEVVIDKFKQLRDQGVPQTETVLLMLTILEMVAMGLDRASKWVYDWFKNLDVEWLQFVTYGDRLFFKELNICYELTPAGWYKIR